MAKIRKPYPGSESARGKGCVCPVLDNAHGRGWMGGVKDDDEEPLFWVSGNCPLHGGALPSTEGDK